MQLRLSSVAKAIGFVFIICGMMSQRSSARLSTPLLCMGAVTMLFGFLWENLHDQQRSVPARWADGILALAWISALLIHTIFGFPFCWIIAACAILLQITLRHILQTKQDGK
ncbi:hypothetical protein BTIS_1421 [Bifidobacterium tissieri]|uniref:Uncharacterized protein n=1 Tax=Bifidobacterium tissieri TaxID=1630162 RepID=A0A261FDW8_9BIFI|nr:hypothetical protein [Bifidobacterium sp. UTCIF-39]OZG57327.1 hypothetical protein BTIS_1421 [Bifidobacterium tissieri]TPF95733.1 hypothetical protein EP30_10200 [Bifidobacterium sp. UTCIF-39]